MRIDVHQRKHACFVRPSPDTGGACSRSNSSWKRRLNYLRALKFAAIQARIRALIGSLPDEQVWIKLTHVPGTELLEGLEDIGVAFWLEGLNPAVSPEGLESHFNGRIRALLERVADWLPDEWDEFGRCLILAPDIFWITPLLSGQDPGRWLDPDSKLKKVVRAAPEQRHGVLEQGPFAPFIDVSEGPESLWREHLVTTVPNLSKGERRPVDRLLSILEDSLAQKLAEYGRLAGLSDSSEVTPGEWRFHRDLEQRLYTVLAGDPFHPALILIHALLELLTMEKLRALLLSRLFAWQPPRALTGSA